MTTATATANDAQHIDKHWRVYFDFINKLTQILDSSKADLRTTTTSARWSGVVESK